MLAVLAIVALWVRAPAPTSQVTSATPRARPATPGFADLRSRAVTAFEAELNERLAACDPAPAARSHARPRAVRLTFEWSRARSTPELQQMEVRDVEVLDDAELSVAARECAERARGMTLGLLVPPDQLPSDARRFVEVLQVPLR